MIGRNLGHPMRQPRGNVTGEHELAHRGRAANPQQRCRARAAPVRPRAPDEHSQTDGSENESSEITSLGMMHSTRVREKTVYLLLGFRHYFTGPYSTPEFVAA